MSDSGIGGELERAVGILAGAARVVVSTGAGMSRESGIPTFRDAREGLWLRYDPQQLATRDGFLRQPGRVWGWYNYRRRLISRCEPHAGHVALAGLEAVVPDLVVVTQNIDGLHQRAGSTRVIELHGNIHRFKCFEHGHPATAEVPIADVDGEVEPPTCERCGSPLRPDVVWFGEPLPPGSFACAESLVARCGALLIVGTSGLVYPAAGLAHSARAAGAELIELNIEASGMTSGMDVFLRGPAGEILPRLRRRIEQEVTGENGV